MTAGPFAIDLSLPPAIPTAGPGSTITIGTFDGVHRGHVEVLGANVGRARESGRRSVLATFDPHPLRVVRPESAPPLLTTVEEKTELLAQVGLDFAVFIPFTRTLQQYSARRFVEEILIGRLRMEELVIGYDHGFGRGREGDVETMRALGDELGFATHVVDAVSPDAQQRPISSTQIRRAVAAGEMSEAALHLGRPYSLRGSVVRGAQRGRTLGFPTANLLVEEPHKLLPPDGIYAVHGLWRGRTAAGVLHLGPVPAFGSADRTIELHLLDFEGDLYGERVEVRFLERLREVRPYTSAEALVEQMQRDVADARRLLRLSGRLSG